MSADHLQTLLDDTRTALLIGDLEALEALALQTEAALLGPLPQDATELRALQSRAEENATLMEAAARGIASARRLGDAEAQSQTYDASGRRGRIGPAAKDLARRL